MSEYYGIQSPSSDFMAHYGVKGMKWGVRKAIEKGNTRALNRHYKKALKKLEKLSKRTDIELQSRKANKYNKISKVSRRIGHVGVGVAGLSVPTGIIQNNILKSGKAEKEYLAKQYGDKINKELEKINKIKKHDWDNWRNSAHDGTYKSLGITKEEAAQRIQNQHNNMLSKNKKYKTLVEDRDTKIKSLDSQIDTASKRRNTATITTAAAGGLAALGYGTAIGSKIKAHTAKKLTTKEGHAKAVADRDAWRNQMAETFKGTKYANLPSVPKKKKRR